MGSGLRASGCRLDTTANGGFSSEAGQTFTEYTMILGLLTAMIIALTGIIVPGLGQVVVGLVNHMLVFMGSPAP